MCIRDSKERALTAIKGQVISDYQTFLEKEWIAELTQKSTIEIKKRQLRKLINFYKKK